MGWNGRNPSLDFGVGSTKLGKSVNMGHGGWTNNSEMTWAGVKVVQTYEAEFFMACHRALASIALNVFYCGFNYC